MPLTIQEAIETQFLDTAHYDVVLEFTSGYEGVLNSLAVHNARDLIPFTYVKGELKTPEYTMDVYVTEEQDRFLQALYEATMHPGFVDQRYPVYVSWGIVSNTQYMHTVKCYLSEYTPPDSVDFKSAEILSATLVLRAI